MINKFKNTITKVEEELNISIGICALQEVKSKDDKNYLSYYLSNNENLIYNSFKFKKRKNDWSIGRIAAKRAYSKFTSNTPSNITILNNDDGSPHIVGIPDLSISISHSNGIAIAAISEKNIGIDLEIITDHNESILNYFFSTSESDKVFRYKDKNIKNELITKFWTRKEAISKYLKKGMKLNFKSIDILDDKFFKKDLCHDIISLQSTKIENFFFSIAT